ncbi:MAG: glycosyltransferase, partial [Chloroflexota bacterium]|nr:glycosyltransferase [Chloroflexota bacterium]
MTGPPAIHGPAPPDAAGRPFISVIVPSYNRRDSLVTVLDALGRQSYSRDDFEVIVVLDGSTDGSGELLEQLIRERPARAGEEHKNNGEHCKDGEHDRNGGD